MHHPNGITLTSEDHWSLYGEGSPIFVDGDWNPRVTMSVFSATWFTSEVCRVFGLQKSIGSFDNHSPCFEKLVDMHVSFDEFQRDV